MNSPQQHESHRPTYSARPRRIVVGRIAALGLLGSALLTGCSVTTKIADGMTSAVMNHNDPQLVADGLPSFLLGLDGAIASDPKDSQRLLAGAQLYGAYAGAFVDDPGRQKLLAQRAYDYGERALCLKLPKVCDSLESPYDAFTATLKPLKRSNVPVMYGFGTAWAGWIQANTDDWNAIADVPKLTALMYRVVELDENWDNGTAHMYLGVLACQRPASLGGEPEKGRDHFERALELSGERNLMAKVLFAEYYARLVFNESLHDRLLGEVLAANLQQPGFTLINGLAQQRARELIESAKDYF